MTDGASGGDGAGSQKTWRNCPVKGLKLVRAIKGSTAHSRSVFGVEARGVDRLGIQGGKVWDRGFFPESAERFVVGWHQDYADLSIQRHASFAGGAPGNDKGGGNSRK